MKSAVIFSAVALFGAVFAAPLESSNEASNLFARKLCVSEDGIACYYDNNQCYWHDCSDCSCEDVYNGAKLIRRDCTDAKDAATCPNVPDPKAATPAPAPNPNPPKA
ncbi:hypothetical protein CGCSCA4_v010902 [Colletotrichum siamense]|uniref:Uncharacterized protein n=1 Tax=Colletotrichum siamense TaxID=690259 RepID=A0A9P5ESG0_COLSI|nr:hypothetical protein CGCSCA4_v010902 [Colletotrichum siamense]KAF4858606.1 hypothetical protein CGCSCA2_v007114 [Colletotrichum siamense]KAI8215245.1 hypothetical protein K4K52_009672 [Colletotrichum sp. SAR 10_76]KAI8270518.1 hypothetical protein K4K58_009854 [Colletotrichum sp. SAR11_239]